MSRRYMTPPATFSYNSSWESFNKLFTSVADLQTQKNHARHLALTKNILYENEAGWKVAELPLVSDLLQLLRDKVVDGVPQFAEQLVLAITRCGRPFIRQKSNEEISNPGLFYNLLPTLGELLSFEDIEVQVAAAEALRMFATGSCLARPGSKSRNSKTDSKVDDLRLTPRIFSQNVLEETGTVDAIVAVMHDLFPDDEREEEEESQSQDSELIDQDPDVNEDQMSTDVQISSNQPSEELLSNGEVDVDDIPLEDNGEVEVALDESIVEGEETATKNEDNAARPLKPQSAPPISHKGSSFLETRGEAEDITRMNEPSTSRTAKPASAPSTLQRGTNSNRAVKTEVIRGK
ncbi:hypothetical protein PInf_011676 [Phytophthora infestans]|nr:hypothetical protein PInf_011676 [Phytophthora infestans]